VRALPSPDIRSISHGAREHLHWSVPSKPAGVSFGSGSKNFLETLDFPILKGQKRDGSVHETTSRESQLADDAPKKVPYIELIAGLLVIVSLASIALYYVATRVVPGVAPVAAQGAQVAKLSDLLFYVLSGAAIVSAAGVALARNIIYSALALLGALLSTGGLYIYLSADYVAITQLLVYVGGVLVLILFAVMLTNQISDKRHTNPSTGVLPGLVLLGALVLLLGFVATKTPWKVDPVAAAAFVPTQTARTLGTVFLQEYLLPFEVASLVLLATLIGAVVVARKELKEV
jgi:NAD(P)H-quinone oxidoreductase subunit 6